MRAKSVGEKYKKVCSQQERSPQHSRSDGEEVANVSSLRVFARTELAVRESSHLRKVKIRVPPVFLESQIVLDQGRASVSVVSDAVAMHDRIHKRQ